MVVIAAVLALIVGGGFLAYTLFVDTDSTSSPPAGDDASEVVFPEQVGDFELFSRTTSANPSDIGQDVPTAAYKSGGEVFAVYAIPGVSATDLLETFKVTDTTDVAGTTCGALPASADRTLCATDSSPHGVGAFHVSGHSVEATADFVKELAATIG